jgi:hypothetical protein
MVHKKIVYLVSICTLLVQIKQRVNAQSTEFGFAGGSSYYIGELNPKTLYLNKPSYNAGIFFRRNLNWRESIRIQGNYIKLKAEDPGANLPFNTFRNVAFESTVYHLTGLFEFNFFPYEIHNKATAPATPYLFTGFTAFYYNSSTSGQAFYNTPLNYNHSDSQFSFAIPFGIGVKFNFAQRIGLALEWQMNKTFTDRLDAIENRLFENWQWGKIKNKDWYNITNIMLIYRFRRKNERCPGVN